MNKFKTKSVMLFLTICFSATLFSADIVDEIYAVVNGEVITYSELHKAEQQWAREIKAKFSGADLEKALARMKRELMDSFIERKLLLAKAKENKYDVENDVKVMVEEIKKQNNFKSDEQLKAALRSEGINFKDFMNQQRWYRMQQRLIYEEVTSKIKIDNAEIMDYYKKNIKTFTIPAKFVINCIFLKAENYTDEAAFTSRSQEISQALKTAEFVEVAKKYSELDSPDNNYYLGEFNEGELDKNLEKGIKGFKAGEKSQWIKTDSGWYILQLVKHTPSSLVEYEKVREDIRRRILAQRHQKKQVEYIAQLKKESYIKIYKRY